MDHEPKPFTAQPELKETELPALSLETALAHGSFYFDLMDLIRKRELASNNAPLSDLKKVVKDISQQSPAFQEIYRAGVRTVLTSLRTEDQKLQQLQSTERKALKHVLIDLLLKAPGDAFQMHQKLKLEKELEQSPSPLDQVDLVTFAPGLYGLQADTNLISKLSPFNGWQFCQIHSKELDQFIRFLILPKDVNLNDPMRAPVLQHELHHFIWSCLKESGQITATIQVDSDIHAIKENLKAAGKFHPLSFPEKTIRTELTEAFETFRNELVGYLLSYKVGGFPPLDMIAEATTHVGLDLPPSERGELEVNKLAAKTMTELAALITVMQQKPGMTDPDVERLFIYPAMKATCFTELIAMCQKISQEFLQA